RGRRRAHLDRTARRARFACNARRKPDAHHLLPLGPRAARADPALRHRGLVEALLAVSFVRTLVLVAIALGLGAWLWFVEAPKAIQEAKKDFLADFDPAAVEKIQLSYTDQPQIEIVKQDDNWKLTKPVAYPAEKSVVENFLTTIKEAKIERRLEKNEAGALESNGLQAPNDSSAPASFFSRRRSIL